MNVLTALKHVVRKGAMAFTNHTPEMLMVAGTGAFIATIVMAVKSSPDIEDTFEDALKESNRLGMAKPKQVAYISVKVAPKAAPTILMGASTLACFYGAHHIQTKRQIALASLYTMASQTLNTYQEKVIEEFGEEKHKSIIEKVLAEDEPIKDVGDDPDIYEGSGETLCYDRVTGRYFKSSPERIREAEGKISTRLIDEMWVPLNYFYECLGLDDFSFIGEAIGWDVQLCLPRIEFRSMLDECNRPCLALIYNTTVLNSNSLRAK